MIATAEVELVGETWKGRYRVRARNKRTYKPRVKTPVGPAARRPRCDCTSPPKLMSWSQPNEGSRGHWRCGSCGRTESFMSPVELEIAREEAAILKSKGWSDDDINAHLSTAR